MSGHRPDGSLPPYYSGPKPEHCECGAELQYDGDYTEQYWSAVGDEDASTPCPVWDVPWTTSEHTHTWAPSEAQPDHAWACTTCGQRMAGGSMSD